MIFQKMIKNAIKEKIADIRPQPHSNKPKAAVIFDLSKDFSKGLLIADRFQKEGNSTYLVLKAPSSNSTIKTLHLSDVNESGVSNVFAKILSDDVDIDIVIVVGMQERTQSFLNIKADDLYDEWQSNCLLHFYVAQSALESMLKFKSGTIIFSGTSSSLHPKAGRAGEASNKVGVRMLAQSLAREFGPKGVHVAHVIDESSDSISPQYSNIYWSLYRQHKTTWTQEMVCQ